MKVRIRCSIQHFVPSKHYHLRTSISQACVSTHCASTCMMQADATAGRSAQCKRFSNLSCYQCWFNLCTSSMLALTSADAFCMRKSVPRAHRLSACQFSWSILYQFIRYSGPGSRAGMSTGVPSVRTPKSLNLFEQLLLPHTTLAQLMLRWHSHCRCSITSVLHLQKATGCFHKLQTQTSAALH